VRDYLLQPFRPDRRRSDRRTSKTLDLEQTQFRALGWSLRYRRKLTSAADYALALAIMGAVGLAILSLVAIPVSLVVGLAKWIF